MLNFSQQLFLINYHFLFITKLCSASRPTCTPTFLLLGTFPYLLPTFRHFRLLFADFFFPIFDIFLTSICNQHEDPVSHTKTPKIMVLLNIVLNTLIYMQKHGSLEKTSIPPLGWKMPSPWSK